MKVLFCSSEVAPIVKTGGLADVSGALPLALDKLGVEVRIVMPGYKTVTGHGLRVTGHGARVSGNKEDIEVIKIGKGIPVYLIKNDKYFGREGLYGDKRGDYPDNLERFSFYCRRTLELLKDIDFKPDIIHCNDWQTALIPAYLRNTRQNDDFYKGIKTLFTIHNLAYQGVFEEKEFPKLGLPRALFGIDALEFYRKINLLKGGLIFSDLLSTVSRTYAREIQTKELGCGLEGVLAGRSRDIFGIVNGIDYDYWDPEKDGYIYKRYSSKSREDKYANRRELLKEYNLSLDDNSPLFGMVGRLVMQKGLDLLAKSLSALINKFGLRLIILGTGDEKYHDLLKSCAKKYPGHLLLHTWFDEPLAHKIYAASDIFLMPSHYEPCGLGQMIALRYGSIPLVFKTGGLADTVSEDNGFVFEDYTPEALVAAAGKAVRAYQDKKRWDRLVAKAFTCNFSWEASAKKYVELYKRLK